MLAPGQTEPLYIREPRGRLYYNHEELLRRASARPTFSVLEMACSPVLSCDYKRLSIPTGAARPVVNPHEPWLFRIKLHAVVSLLQQRCPALNSSTHAVVPIYRFVTTSGTAVFSSHLTHGRI